MDQSKQELLELWAQLTERNRRYVLAMLRGIVEYGDDPLAGIEELHAEAEPVRVVVRTPPGREPVNLQELS